jgi:hypothetical protein
VDLKISTFMGLSQHLIFIPWYPLMGIIDSVTVSFSDCNGITKFPRKKGKYVAVYFSDYNGIKISEKK